MSIAIAFRAFFRAMVDRQFSDQARCLLSGEVPALPAAAGPASKPVAAPEPRVAAPPAQPRRSEAIELLAVLQREGRLVDFLTESIDGYSDAQIGAAVREVHRDCAGALERMLALRPLLEKSEGDRVEVSADAGALRYHLIGDVSGAGPHHGVLRHRGWRASKIELPRWSGDAAAANIIAPAEVEL